ncbi:MAG: signal protein [Actinomycetia bacterium]|nr:signal protein [Actinomycetes bacterium]
MGTRRARRRITVVVALTVMVAGCSSSASNKAASPTINAATSSTTAAPPPAQPGIPAIVQKVSPSVVTIITNTGLGSGVVWSSDGTIVTDNHVVAGASQVEVAFADGRRVTGRVLARDPTTDLAVLKAARTGLPALTFAKSLPQVGDLAIAIGSPLGFENTASAGIISGLQRSLPGTPGQTLTLIDLLQTDAAISPGDSGGALVDGQGHVVGINEAYIPPSAGAVSIGFATAATTVDQIVPQLLKNGKAVHAYFGAQLADLTPDIARQLGMKVTQGVVVLAVVAGGPAAKAGIAPGDVITAVDSTPVQTVEDFIAAVRARKPGDVLTVKTVRGSATITRKVTLSEQPG